MSLRLDSYLDFAVETAYLAGRLTLGYFQTGLHIEYKEDQSPITLADRQAEELIRQRIEDRYPGHEIVGEEFGVKETNPNGFAQYGRQGEWDRIRKATYYRAGWGDACGYCLVAKGRSEIMLDPVMNVWDSAPFPAILKEAGGYFGDWMGNPTIYSNEAMATNGELLAELLGLIQGVT